MIECIKNLPQVEQMSILYAIQTNIYLCVYISGDASPENKTYSLTACKWTDVDFACDHGRPPAITIVSADYGRMDPNVCPSLSQTYENCKRKDTDVKQLLKRRYRQFISRCIFCDPFYVNTFQHHVINVLYLSDIKYMPIISTYINTKMFICLSVCYRLFLGHFETDLETLWHEVSI